MSLAAQIASDISAVFLNTDDFAESVILIDGHGVERTITAIVDRLPQRVELRSGHRLRIEPAEIYATDDTEGLGGAGDEWAAKLDTAPEAMPFDFIEFREHDGGMQSALFERATILETGVPQPADI